MPGPLGITPLQIDPPNFTDGPSFTEILNDTMGDSAKALADLDAQLEEAAALQSSIAADVPALDALSASIEAALLDMAEIQWGSPEPDLAPLSDYVAAQNASIAAIAGSTPAPGAVPLLLPDGGQSITLGLPPADGGSARAGDPPYTLHFHLGGNLAVATGLAIVSASGPNPPFTGSVSLGQEAGSAGPNQNTLLIDVNPVDMGSFTITVKMTGYLAVGGLVAFTSITQPVVVNVVAAALPPPAGPPPPVPLPTYVLPVTRLVSVSRTVTSVVVTGQPQPNPPFQSFVVTGFSQSRSQLQISANLTIDPNVAAHGNYGGGVVLTITQNDGSSVSVTLPLVETV